MDYLTLGSLFDGSGGFPLAAILSGIQPLWASEIEPFPIRVTTKRLPQVRHYGDVSSLSGANLPPVDIITFGSPCQDMSIAGKRAGLGGERSVLFHEAIRIIREMREKTNGEYPRYCVWENVPGAFSSNNGEDFKAVLEAVIGVKEPSITVPAPDQKGWPYADVYLGDGWSVAYRLLDAQYWGVPQRRARIFLVADFAGERAGDILFKSEGVSGYSAEGFRAWQRFARYAENSSGASGLCLNDQGGEYLSTSNEVSSTLRAESHGHPPAVLASGFCTEHSANSRSIGYREEVSPTLRAECVPAAVYENHAQDSRYGGPLETAPTVNATYGMGGNNQPLVVESPAFTLKIRSGKDGGGKGALIQTDISATLSTRNNQTLFQPDKNAETYDVRFTSARSKIVRANCYKTNVCRCLDSGMSNPDSNQGGIAVVERIPVFSSTMGSFLTASEEVGQTLMARDYKNPQIINQSDFIVRRLTPVECARLQGFPDCWCQGLETANPTNEEIAFWTDVFETHRRLVTHAAKPKTRKQIVKWLKCPYLDSSAYRMWGNGVALPCVWFVLAGIAFYDKCKGLV